MTTQRDCSRRTFLKRTGIGAGALAMSATMVRSGGVLGQEASPAAGLDQADTIDRFVQEALESYDVPGAAVAVVLGGETVLLKGYGVRELGNEAPVDEETVFQLASNSKPFTAAGLATLVDEGLLGWDDPIADHLPEFMLSDPYATRYVSTRDLLAHRSGLPAFSGDLLGLLGFDRAEVLHRVRFVELGGFRDEARYSNIGFFAAGEVLAHLAGATYEEAVSSRLFEPIGLTRTSATGMGKPADDNWARNHAVVDGTLQPIEWADSVVFSAAGGVTSCAADMARWMRMHLSGGVVDGNQLLAPETVDELFKPSMVVAPTFTDMPPIDDDSGLAFGMGWGSFHVNGHEVIEKGGALDGIRTVVNLIPKLGLGVAVMATRNLTAFPEAVRAFVLEQYIGAAASDTQAEIAQHQTALDQLFVSGPGPTDPGPASRALDSYTGTYENDLYGAFDVVADADHLALEASLTGYRGALTHFSYDTFLLHWPEVTEASQEVTFIPGPDGSPTGFMTETLGAFVRRGD